MEETETKEESLDAAPEKPLNDAPLQEGRGSREQDKQGKDTEDLDEMMEAGLHFGHKTSKTHPKMKPYIGGVRNTIHLINLEKTKEKLKEALEVVSDIVANKKTLFLVGTKVQVKGPVHELAIEAGLPYVTEHWIGGLFTNFEMVQKRIEHLKDLESQKESEDFTKYTKKERLDITEEIKKLEKKFGGLKNMERLPDAIFVFDLDENELAVKEAKQKGIQVLAIVDTNCDPTTVDYAIPANDDAVSSVKYIVEKVKNAIQDGKNRSPVEISDGEND